MHKPTWKHKRLCKLEGKFYEFKRDELVPRPSLRFAVSRWMIIIIYIWYNKCLIKCTETIEISALALASGINVWAISNMGDCSMHVNKAHGAGTPQIHTFDIVRAQKMRFYWFVVRIWPLSSCARRTSLVFSLRLVFALLFSAIKWWENTQQRMRVCPFMDWRPAHIPFIVAAEWKAKL